MKKRKADISLGSTEKEREAVVRRIKKIQKLMRNFELDAFAFDPGVRCYAPGSSKYSYKIVDIDENVWCFIEPLLIELVKWRKYGEKFGMNWRRKYGLVCKKSKT